MGIGQKVAIVTGASGRLGGEISRRLASEGIATIVAFHTHRDRADNVVDDIHANGGTASSYHIDVSDPAEVLGLFDAACQRYGGVDIVVHAAEMLSYRPLAEARLPEFDRLVSTNIRGTFMVNQEAARRIRDYGAIINVTREARDTTATHSASRAAVQAITSALAIDLSSRKVTVNYVIPEPQAPPHSGGVVEAVAQLATSARWVTGQVLQVCSTALTEAN